MGLPNPKHPLIAVINGPHSPELLHMPPKSHILGKPFLLAGDQLPSAFSIYRSAKGKAAKREADDQPPVR